MKVLYLTHHGPWPSRSGGRKRDACLLEAIAHRVDLHLWAVTRTIAEDREAFCPLNINDYRLFPDTSEVSLAPSRYSADMLKALEHAMRGPRPFDVIHVEGGYLASILPSKFLRRTCVVEHNIESDVFAQRCVVEGWDAERLFLLRKLRSQEELVWRQAAAIIVLSNEDRSRVISRHPGVRIKVIPNGVDRIFPEYKRTVRETLNTIGYLGNFHYAPSLDGAACLLDLVFPKAIKSIQNLAMLIAGNGSETMIDKFQLPAKCHVMGWLDDPEEFWDAIDLFVCPLRSGGGMKVKIGEALVRGIPVLGTALAGEGYMDMLGARDVLKISTVENMGQDIVDLHFQRDVFQEWQRMGQKNRGKLYNWDSHAEELERTWAAVVSAAH